MLAEKVPYLVTELPGPKGKAWLARDTTVISPSYTRAYPLVVKRGEGLAIEDVDGNVFLDFTAGIAVTATGHCHPHVVDAIRDQAGKLIHMSGTDFYYEPQIRVAERLARLAPGDSPKRVFFANSGAEAVEAAIKLARHRTRRTWILAFYGAFHGRTLGAVSLSASKSIHRAGFAPLMPGVVHVAYPNPFRPPFGGKGEDVSDRVLAYIRDPVLARKVAPEDLAAIIVEPIQGEGGYVVPPPGFHKGLARMAHEAGAVLIMDEVQTGIGRTGRMFASEHFGVVPDILCVAKGIASGMPLGAIVARTDLMQWPPGSHASTFGGNPISCVAAEATLDLVERELMANAAAVGASLASRLSEVTADDPGVGEVRGLGLMLAVDFVKDRSTREYDTKRPVRIMEACYRRGLLTLPCGPSCLRFSPALTVTEAEVETAVGIFREALIETRA